MYSIYIKYICDHLTRVLTSITDALQMYNLYSPFTPIDKLLPAVCTFDSFTSVIPAESLASSIQFLVCVRCFDDKLSAAKRFVEF
jgi:hypothetical protein